MEWCSRDQKRKTKEAAALPFSSLPEDIQVDIFLRLPAKSILNSSCVCKAWYDFLRNPKFIKYHLNHNKQHERSVTSVQLTEYPFHCNKGNRVEILGSCNGLLCLRIRNGTSGFIETCNSMICIWNPTTREYKEIMPYKRRLSTDDCRTRYGFGYDCNTDDYKLVKISASADKPGGFTLQVYTLRSCSWTRRKRIPYSFSNEGSEYPAGMLVNGALHWLGMSAKVSSEPNSEVIVSFVVSDEKLTVVPIPKGSHSPRKRLTVFRDCLCLVTYDSAFRSVLWIMHDYGVGQSWTKQYLVTRYVTSLGSAAYSILWLNGSITDLNSGVVASKTWRLVESLVSLGSGTYVKNCCSR